MRKCLELGDQRGQTAQTMLDAGQRSAVQQTLLGQFENGKRKAEQHLNISCLSD